MPTSGAKVQSLEIFTWQYIVCTAKVYRTADVKSRVKRQWAFSNMVSVIRQQLMSYINIYRFLEDPEGSWRKVVYEQKTEYQNSLFPEMTGACF
jgi:hypothetical protein